MNTKLLKQHIDYAGIKYTVLAYKLGVSRTTLWSRLNNLSEFTTDEVKDLCQILRLTKSERMEIFNDSP